MASNCFGLEPIQKAKRWDRKGKKEVSVDIPYVVHKYNTSMGCLTVKIKTQINTGYQYVPKSGGGLCFHGE